MKFNELVKDERVLKAVEKMGFSEATEIQAKVIPFIYDKQDVIGHAKTGTGKTAAFTIPILEALNYKNKNIQCLVLVPTRELAKQVNDEINKLGKYFDKLKTCVVYGGQSYQKQKQDLRKNPNIVVATPGRLIDLLERRYLSLDDVNYLILDEADEMLSIGFAKELEKIESYINKERQTLLFSATFNSSVNKLSKKYMNNPQTVSVVSSDKVATTITQKYMCVSNNEKRKALLGLLMMHREDMIMIFANTKKEVDSIVESLQEKNVIAEAIHGDLTQKMRENVLAKFKKGTTKVLVCSDVAARGLDIKGVDVIINMDLPFEDEYYVHRVGRTGRANNTGIAYTIISRNKEKKIKSLEKSLKTTITKMDMINNKDLFEMENKLVVDQIEAAILSGKEDHLDKINPLLKKGYDLDSIFHGLLSMVFNEEVAPSSEEVRLFINVGKKDNVTKKDISRLFNLDQDKLYDIDIKKTFSFCTVNVENINKLIKKVSKQKFKKHNINVEIANN
ncbi:ATP-dependent RNA helicase DeaD [Bacilli bacterium PM5-3]|nr:ATP-dependent RNA helicase DeaD [Bacilli bacterium PM5-3]